MVLKKYLFKHKSYLIIGLISVIFTSGLGLLSPWILKIVIDSLRQGVNSKLLWEYALLIVLITSAGGVFRYLMRKYVIGASRKIEYELRNDYFSHLQKLSPSYYDKTKTGELMARATNDLEAVRMVVGPGIMQMTNTLVTAISRLAIMFVLSVKLTLYSLISLPLFSLVVVLLGGVIFSRYKKIQEHYAKISSACQENLSGIRVIKAYVQEDSEIRRFSELNFEYVRKNISLVKLWGIFFPLLYFLAGFAAAIVLWFGGKDVMAQKMTLGEFVAFNSYLFTLIWPMIALGWVISLFQRGSASMKRINEVLNTEPKIKDAEELVSVKELKGKIEFRNLDFKYPGTDNFVLKNINLKIDAGKTVAFVGHTGSGKTTLAELIPRLYPVEDGKVFIDGKDINKIPLATLRSSIGFVPQETFLFSESITDNIVFGTERKEFERVFEVSSIAQMKEEIEGFPQKFETILGERGITLSGGQKQRTALARALALNPKILILDDAFSSVDTVTEEKILSRLKQLLKNKTLIIISHRISTVKDADLIVVLKDGSMMEQGTHSELLQMQGTYAEIYKKQLIKEELDVLK